MKHLFVSPHLDDALLSCYDYMVSLKERSQEIIAVTVFTDFGNGPLSLGARRYLWQSGTTNPVALKSLRVKEDIRAMGMIGVEYYHLGFTDAYFRLNSETNGLSKLASFFGIGNRFLYPYRKKKYSGVVHEQDKKLQDEIYLKIADFSKKADFIYGPAAVGKHVDHILVHQVLRKLEKELNKPVKYWLDFPYAAESPHKRNVGRFLRVAKNITRPSRQKDKYKVLACYKSQSVCRYPKNYLFEKEALFNLT